MPAEGVGTQSIANPRVGAGDTDGDAGPVANMAPCRREDLNHDRLDRLGTLEQRRQVADHAPGFFVGKRHLNGPIQILDDITQRAGNPKDGYLAYGALADRRPRSCSRTAV